MKKLFARFVKDEAGVTAIEYGLIATLIGVAIIVGAGTLGGQLNTTFAGIAGTIAG
jgi:pilus assembly protein Flp/PilA